MLNAEMEEVRNSAEHAERNKKIAESEKHEAIDKLNELTIQNSSFMASKRKLESDLSAMQVKVTCLL